MSGSERSGAELLCAALAEAGVDCVFGLPGTQNVELYDALRDAGLRTIIATHELSASMMANGYFRASGRVAALATIPGPGFTWAMTGLAEAFLDSAGLLHVVGQPAKGPGSRFQLQAIDQAAIARPLAKSIHAIDSADDIGAKVAAAYSDASTGEPGPVLLHMSRAALVGRASAPSGTLSRPAVVAPDADQLRAIAALLRASRRVVIFAGQGAQGASAGVQRLAERLGAAIVTSTSGRGVVAEDHALSLGFELGGTSAATLNALIEDCDLVLAIGVKFSHNASRGFRLRIPEEKLVHVDASAGTLEANYKARIALEADATAFVDGLLGVLEADASRGEGFAAANLDRVRERGRAEAIGEHVEPRIHGVPGGRAEAFFAALRHAMPRDACLVTDSGLHQVLARRWFRVLHPRGLMTPTNLQSMGFAIGASIGACVASPERAVVALIGDGGFMMSGLELLVAVRERLRLTVIVFVDGAYGLIRAQQLELSGRTYGTEFDAPDIGGFAAALGAEHVRLDAAADADAVLKAAIASDRVTIVEVAVGDSLPMHWMRAKAAARAAVRPTARALLRRLRRR